jgi:ribosomal protein S27E
VKLQSTIDSPEIETRVQSAHMAIVAHSHPCFTVFEHGQWWVTCNACGAAWSCVDASGGPSVDGFDFEQVSEGEEF